MGLLRYVEITLGYLLYNFKAGDDTLVLNQEPYNKLPSTIEITSNDFKEGGQLPLVSAGPGVGDSKCPSLSIKNDNAEVKSLVIVCQDIDVPFIALTHLIAYDIDPKGRDFPLGEFEVGGKNDGYKIGVAVRKTKGFVGVRPIVAHGAHRYIFQVFGVNQAATDKLNALQEPPTLPQVLEIITGNIITTGKLGGFYKRD